MFRKQETKQEFRLICLYFISRYVDRTLPLLGQSYCLMLLLFFVCLGTYNYYSLTFCFISTMHELTLGGL